MTEAASAVAPRNNDSLRNRTTWKINAEQPDRAKASRRRNRYGMWLDCWLESPALVLLHEGEGF